MNKIKNVFYEFKNECSDVYNLLECAKQPRDDAFQL